MLVVRELGVVHGVAGPAPRGPGCGQQGLLLGGELAVGAGAVLVGGLPGVGALQLLLLVLEELVDLVGHGEELIVADLFALESLGGLWVARVETR